MRNSCRHFLRSSANMRTPDGRFITPAPMLTQIELKITDEQMVELFGPKIVQQIKEGSRRCHEIVF